MDRKEPSRVMIPAAQGIEVKGRVKLRKGEVEATCPRCGRPSPVTRGAELLACWRCANSGTDALDRERARKSSEFDWGSSLAAICKQEGISQKSLAYRLGIAPSVLAMVKANKRPMPVKTMSLIREKYPDCISLKIKDLRAAG
jgi:ribosome-binding protein aMBF1 (putative translation factor)